MKQKLWIVSELFSPNESATAYILTEIAVRLAAYYDVNVITIKGDYENDPTRLDKQKDETQFPFRIIRLESSSLDKNNLVKRVLRFISVSKKLYNALKKNISNGDAVLTVTNPAFFLLFMRTLKHEKKFEYSLLVHDVFPENLVPVGICAPKNPVYKILLKTFNKGYSAADKLIVLGRDMKEIVSRKTNEKVPVHIVENWGDLKIVPEYNAGKKYLTLQYAGNLGRVQGLKEWIETISTVKNPFLQFQFCGSGAMTDFVKEHQNNTIAYCGSYGRSEQQTVLNKADIAVVTLAKGMKGLGVPSKAYNIMAAGRPILFIGDVDSEIALTVKENDIGWVFDVNDKSRIVTFLTNLSMADIEEIQRKGRKAREVCEMKYSKHIILDKFVKIINSK